MSTADLCHLLSNYFWRYTESCN